MDIWSVDKAAAAPVGSAARWTNSASLSNACRLVRSKRWYAFKESNQADYDRFHNEVYEERGVPSTMMGRWEWHIGD
jgi:hypothetical protein